VLPDTGWSAALATGGCVAPLPNLNPLVPNENPETGFVPKPPGNVELPSDAVVVDAAADAGDEAEKLNSGDWEDCAAGALALVEVAVKKPGLA